MIGRRERSREQAAKPAQDPARFSDWVITRRVLRETKGFRLRILCVIFLGLLATPVALLTPVPLAIVVDNVLGSQPPPSFVSAVLPGWIESSSTQMLVVACVLLVAVAVLGSVQSTAQTVTELVTGERMTLRVQAKLLANAQRQSFAFHDNRGTADAIYRIQKDASAMQALVFSGFIPITSAAFTLVSMIYIVVRIDPELALIALLISPLLFFSAHQYKVRMRPRYTETKELESSAGHVIQEVLTSFRVVKAFGRESAEEARFHHHSMRGLQARVRLALAENIYSIIVTLTTAMGSAVVLFVGVRNVQAGTLSLGELLIVVGYISQLYGPLKTLSKSLSGLQNQFASTERAFQLLDEVPDVVERPNARSIGRSLGRIEFDNVTFGYDAKSPVLQSVTATVPAGSSLGVMGRTGSGKTTLVSLLPRFYDPTQGRITLDGVDIRDYKLADLRRQFAIVLQDPLLFATSIADNIAYARPDASEEDVVRAAQAAGAHEFISRLPDGYQTKVGERGMRLSGGERQRISIARAFLADAPILILDEPTSSVDVTTEAGIMETMTQLMEGRTTIMIAHRLSTLERCDLLVKVEDGAVSRCNSSADEPNVSLVSHDAAPNRRRWMSHVRLCPASLDMVAAAWNRCTGDALRARNVVPIRPKRWWEWGHHLYVFKIERNDSSYEKPAVAMLCSSERVAFERRVYEDLLSQTAISRPEYFGSFPADTPGLAWQFLEFVEYRSFRRADPSHAVAMASWLGSLHAASREWASSAVLPSRGLDFHLSQLATAKHKLVSARNHGEYLRSAERERAENIVALLEDVDRCLLDNGGAVRESPRGFVHADLKSDNIGFVAGREPRLLPYDWEFAGWGPLAVDVGTTLVHRDVIFAYLRALRAAWPDISASDVEHMGCIGELLRAVMAIRWLSDGIPLTPADKVLRGIEAQLDIIEARREELSW